MRLKKVIAYILRDTLGGTGRELLVFLHRDYPEAGLQVPAGTLEEGESAEEGLLREIEEESGLQGCRIERKLGVFEWTHAETQNVHERHVFVLEAPQGTTDAWSWIETGGGAVSEEDGYVFLYHWEPINGDFELVANQGDYLRLI